MVIRTVYWPDKAKLTIIIHSVQLRIRLILKNFNGTNKVIHTVYWLYKEKKPNTLHKSR